MAKMSCCKNLTSDHNERWLVRSCPAIGNDNFKGALCNFKQRLALKMWMRYGICIVRPLTSSNKAFSGYVKQTVKPVLAVKHFKIEIYRYGVELLELEKVTVECIQETLQTMEDTEGKPFSPRDMIHLLIENILVILVKNTAHIYSWVKQ